MIDRQRTWKAWMVDVATAVADSADSHDAEAAVSMMEADAPQLR